MNESRWFQTSTAQASFSDDQLIDPRESPGEPDPSDPGIQDHHRLSHDFLRPNQVEAPPKPVVAVPGEEPKPLRFTSIKPHSQGARDPSF